MPRNAQPRKPESGVDKLQPLEGYAELARRMVFARSDEMIVLDVSRPPGVANLTGHPDMTSALFRKACADPFARALSTTRQIDAANQTKVE